MSDTTFKERLQIVGFGIALYGGFAVLMIVQPFYWLCTGRSIFKVTMDRMLGDDK